MENNTEIALFTEKEIKEATNSKELKKIFDVLNAGEKLVINLTLRKVRKLEERKCVVTKNKGRGTGYNVQWEEAGKNSNMETRNVILKKDDLRSAIVSGKFSSMREAEIRKNLNRLSWE